MQTMQPYSAIPRVGLVDDSIAFRREGYTYVSSRCDALRSDLFRTRLLLQPVVCARGHRAAEDFYAAGAFTRTGAMPKSVQHLLQDEGSVQDLDGGDHAARKALFLRLLDDDVVDDFVEGLRAVWSEHARGWASGRRVELRTELSAILTEAALRWLGLPGGATEVRRRWLEMASMIEYAGSFGPRNWWARAVRRRSEAWAARTVETIRADAASPSTGSMAAMVAHHRGSDGEMLPPEVAAVELLNLVRPIVAIGRFAEFAAAALWTFPGWRERIRADAELIRPFVQEVRRYYPFFPVVGGRALAEVELAGYQVPVGTWVVLDLYGTDHEGERWSDPWAFRPERFEGAPERPEGLVPQGAGEYADGHRCPGERLTVAALAELVRLLSEDGFTLPAQDLTFGLTRMPARPRSGVVLERA